MLLLSILCLFGFCLVAQVQPRRNTGQPAKSKVYLLHSDVLKKSKDNPDPNAQILVGDVAFRHDSIAIVLVFTRRPIHWKPSIT